MNFYDQISELSADRRQVFFRWLTALGQKESEAQRIAKQFEKGELTPEETWVEVVRVYGGNQS